MKKLFLYITFAALLFLLTMIIGYGVTKVRYSNKTNKKTEVENTNSHVGDKQENYEIDEHENEKYEFKLVICNGYVTVLDKYDEIYDMTDIDEALLSEDVIQEINAGKYFDDIEMLYNYLESLAS